MVIRWSEDDQAYVVLLPEFPDVSQPCTHGETNPVYLAKRSLFLIL